MQLSSLGKPRAYYHIANRSLLKNLNQTDPGTDLSFSQR